MASNNTIHKLIERYEGKPRSEWDEANTKRHLLEPFWELLGWDIENPNEVILEKKVREKEHTKNADYCFQHKGKELFLVEAKQPSKNLTSDKDAIYQIKMYVYNTGKADTFLGILHDFEEFVPFIVTKQPDINQPWVGKLEKFAMRYTDYVERTDDLFSTFSKEAVLTGSLEKLLPKQFKLDKNAVPVTRDFFENLREWRKQIAGSIIKKRPDIGEEEINEAVNDFLNRIMFLRIIEDREIEQGYTLANEMSKWKREQRSSLWVYVRDLFEKMAPRYNGALFEKAAEDKLRKIEIDDNTLYKLLDSLYYPQCPYQFSQMPVEIIGNAYEKYLGEIIVIKGKKTSIDPNPLLRKGQGVYYTPKYIVQYIVEQTVGRLLESPHTKSDGSPHPKSDKSPHPKSFSQREKDFKATPKQVRQLKILDPACGSGSFLIGAYEKIIAYYIEYYTNHPKENKGFLIVRDSIKKLSLQLKKQILTDNIFGVDIDHRAVDITKFSLYVKMMEGEEFNSLLGETILPDLSDNIKCGNSLIGDDILEMDILPPVGSERDEVLKKINPFNWGKEFPQVFGSPHPKSFSQREKDFEKPSPFGKGCAEGAGEGIIGKKDTLNGRYDYSPHYVIELARKLRKEDNAPEKILWELLRDRKFIGLKFRRQHAIDRYIADFYCHDLALVIEIDGSVHDTEFQKEYDKNRDDFLKAKGYRVLRIRAKDVMEKTWEVLEDVAQYLPSPCGPSPSGRGTKLPSPFGRRTEDEGAFSAGFDAVIGNPPYLLLQEVENNKIFYDFFGKRFVSAQYKVDMFHLFLQRGIELLRCNGYLGFITPNTYLLNKFNDKLRKFILDSTAIREIILNDNKVFPEASVDTAISIFERNCSEMERRNCQVQIINKLNGSTYQISQKQFIENELFEFNVFQKKQAESWMAKVESKSICLGKFADAYFGIQTFDRKKYVGEQKIDDNWKQIIDGGDISRYQIKPRKEYVHFIPEAIKSGGKRKVYEQAKIVVRQIGESPIAALDENGLFSLNTIYNIYLKQSLFDLRYVLGIINSQLIRKYWLLNFYDHKPTFPKIKKEPLHRIPIRSLNLSNPAEKSQHDLLVSLVSEMLAHHKRLAEAKDDKTKDIIQKQIEITDKKIDALVYELYGLTEEEIRVVEGK